MYPPMYRFFLPHWTRMENCSCSSAWLFASEKRGARHESGAVDSFCNDGRCSRCEFAPLDTDTGGIDYFPVDSHRGIAVDYGYCRQPRFRRGGVLMMPEEIQIGGSG